MSLRAGHGMDGIGFGIGAMAAAVGATAPGGHRGVGAAQPPPTTPASAVGRHGSGARGSNQPFGGAMGLTPPASQSPRRARDESQPQAEQGTKVVSASETVHTRGQRDLPHLRA